MTARNLTRLRAVMQTRALTCEQVAEIVGRSVSTVYMYRSGLRAVPEGVVDKLEAWFRADSEALIASTGAPTAP